MVKILHSNLIYCQVSAVNWNIYANSFLILIMIVNNNNKQGFCLISDSKSRIVTCVLNKKMTLHSHYLLHIDSVYVLKIAIKQAGIKLQNDLATWNLDRHQIQFSFFDCIILKAMCHTSCYAICLLMLRPSQILMLCEEMCSSTLLGTSLNRKVLNFKSVTITNVCDFCQITNSEISKMICLSLMIFFSLLRGI